MTDIDNNFDDVRTLRLQANHLGPLRGGEYYQFGFYDAGVLRQAINETETGYRVYAAPVPSDRSEFEQIKELLRDPELQYAMVDKNKVVFVYIDGYPGWMSVINNMGYVVNSGPKTNKRLKSFHRPTLLNAHFDNLNIMMVEDGEYSRYDFNDPNQVAAKYRTPEMLERLGDGGFIISKRLIQASVKNLPVFEQHEENAYDQDYYYDPRIRKFLVHDLLNAAMFNVRLIWSDPETGENAFLKGNAAAVDLPDGIDVIATRSNIKKEIGYKNGYRFLAEPQGPKSRVVTDDQTMLNFPKMFRKSDMEMWLAEEYKKAYKQATSGELLTNWKSIYQRIWKDNEDLNDNEARARMAYVGYRWTAAGFKMTNSPWLFETTSMSHVAPLRNRVPIPCSVYEQIMPESFARMAGFNIEVEEGTIRRCNELGVHVVNDLDWLEMYESHGGHDQDDFFKLFYRTMNSGEYDGEKVVVAVRSPNGFGEYSIFRYVENEWYPRWHKADDTEISFPVINGRGWPERLSDSIRQNKVNYSGLPSSRINKPKRTGPYTPDDVIRDVEIAMAGGNVGGFVNACMAHSMVIGKHRPVQLCSLEDAIDKCINPDDADDVTAIDIEAEMMMREVIESGKPIDKLFYERRGLKRFLKFGETPILGPGKISQLSDLCDQYHKEFKAKIVEWSQENARPSEIVHQLGKRMYYRAIPHLRYFRLNLYNKNSSEQAQVSGGIERTGWEDAYMSIVNEINKYERFQDRYDFVLGLYSCTLNIATSSGKITDQVVMNRFVYPILEAALQYYGVANITMYSMQDNKMEIKTVRNTQWYWPDENGVFKQYDDPVSFQAAHAVDSPVVWTMPKSNNKPGPSMY